MRAVDLITEAFSTKRLSLIKGLPLSNSKGYRMSLPIVRIALTWLYVTAKEHSTYVT
jgi:hypothetical protein